jgi:hypothetical protein
MEHPSALIAVRRRSPSCTAARYWPVAAARARTALEPQDQDPMARVHFDPVRTSHPHHRTRVQPWPPDLDPTDQIRPAGSNPPPPVKPTLTLAVLQRKPRVSLDLQAGPPTVIVFSRTGPVFFVLA